MEHDADGGEVMKENMPADILWFSFVLALIVSCLFWLLAAGED